MKVIDKDFVSLIVYITYIRKSIFVLFITMTTIVNNLIMS